MEQTNWPPEHSEALGKKLAQCLPFSEIVKAINLKFGTAYTRDAAIGRARRMGLGGPDRPQPLLSGYAATAGENYQTPADRARVGRNMLSVTNPEGTGAADAALRRRRAAASFADRARARRLPLSLWRREAITFCGQPRRPGSSYCAPHFQLSRNPVAPPEHEASDNAIWLRILETL